jgi:glycosyltransferase involved in cell wall biosynthesis
MRVAVCHEWLTTYGGSEQVAQRLAEVAHATDVFTFTARPELAAELFGRSTVRAHRWGFSRTARKHWQWFLPVMPWAWSHLDLRDFDLVVTSSHACVNAISVPEGTLHVSYCHTPMRYAWRWREEIGRIPPAVRPVWPLAAAALRRVDRSWAEHVDLFIANSRHVAGHIRSVYGREAAVVYPPVDTSYWTPGGHRDDYFLIAGRLVAYKRVDVAIRAARLAGVRVVVAGDGPALDRLKRIAGPEVEFVRSPDRDALRELYRHARAFVMPGVEDFGMTMVEAQACGTPVIAYRAGGALEAVREGVTGILYASPSATTLARVMRGFQPEAFTPAALRAHVEAFDKSTFDARIKGILDGLSRGEVSRRSVATS